MCGRLNVTDDPYVQALVESLGIDLEMTPINPNRFVRAAGPVQLIRQVEGKNQLQQATWWLLLEPSASGFKASKYTSFNTRYDKLNVPRSAGFIPFRQSRCIIPAKGFGETEFEYLGKKKVPKHYHDMVASDGAIAFAGLCKEYFCKETGEQVVGCSVITLPPHQKLADIHSKSCPMMLPQDERMLEWLDCSNDVELFQQWLTPVIWQDLVAQQIDKPSNHNPIAEPFIIEADAV